MPISFNVIQSILAQNLLALEEEYKNELKGKEGYFPRDEWGNNALMIAALNNRLEVAKWLVENGLCNLSEVHDNGWDALTLAANRNSLEVIEFLTERFALSLSQFNNAGFSPFLAAAMGGSESVIVWLLKNRGAAACEREVTFAGKNGLLLAAINSHVPIIKQLCRAGFNIETKSFQGRTALLEAALNNRLEVIKYLIHKKAYLGATDNDGWNAATLAANKNYLEIIQYISSNFSEYLTMPNKAGLTPLLAASINGAADVARFLIKVLPVSELRNETTKEGRNALMLAAINNDVTTIVLLYSSGFSLEETTATEGRTALMEAAAEGNLEVVKFLTENGANFLAKDTYHFSLFHLAAYANRTSILKYYFSLEQHRHEIKTLLLEKADCGRLPCDMSAGESISRLINNFLEGFRLSSLHLNNL